MNLTSENVSNTFLACLYKDTPSLTPPDDALAITGITVTAWFDKKSLEEKKEDIKKLLDQLPEAFFVGKGGGWSFLNACDNRQGLLWTGEQRVMQELFLLGEAIGCVKACISRDMWPALPGGVPYYVIDLKAS